MSIEKPPISPDVNFENNGRQFSCLRIPCSRNTSAWGAVLVPIIGIKNGNGPTVLFVEGNHGGEYDGVVSFLKLRHNLEPDKVQGRVIIMPALDAPTVQAGDVILYQGNAFVIYYAPNSRNFTRLGKINNVTAVELKEILGDGNVTITLSLPSE